MAASKPWVAAICTPHITSPAPIHGSCAACANSASAAISGTMPSASKLRRRILSASFPSGYAHAAYTTFITINTNGINASAKPLCCARSTRKASEKRASVSAAPMVTTHQ